MLCDGQNLPAGYFLKRVRRFPCALPSLLSLAVETLSPAFNILPRISIVVLLLFCYKFLGFCLSLIHLYSRARSHGTSPA